MIKPSLFLSSHRLCLLMLFALLPLGLTKGARAQSSPVEILSHLKGQPLFLRGLWAQDDLRFTHDGRPLQPYRAGPFTLAGIDVEKVSFSGDNLEIKGRRVGLEFGSKAGPRRVQLGWSGYSGKVFVHIAGHKDEDFGPALSAIFAPDLPAAVPSLGLYWARVGDAYLKDANLDQAVDEAANEQAEAAVTNSAVPNATANTTAARVDQTPLRTPVDAGKPAHIGAGVRPPVLVSQVDPRFSRAAHGMMYSGDVEVYLWVDSSGVPGHLRVVRATGMGLDEEALAAVAAYRFRPATQNGVPVAVDLYVDVNFRIF